MVVMMTQVVLLQHQFSLNEILEVVVVEVVVVVAKQVLVLVKVAMLSKYILAFLVQGMNNM
jgi:hypothetical protein